MYDLNFYQRSSQCVVLSQRLLNLRSTNKGKNKFHIYFLNFQQKLRHETNYSSKRECFLDIFVRSILLGYLNVV
jgi:hypothetical protein